jgi:hypothetical protein
MKARMTGEGNPMYGKTGILSPVWIENREEVVIIQNKLLDIIKVNLNGL